jgi:uncharacterized protein with PQ loop repeat
VLRRKIIKKPKKDFLDYLVYLFAVATPMFELPQAITIYVNQSAENVSILTWGFFLLADVVWLVYAIRHRLPPLVVLYIIFLVVEASIVAGIFIYS